MKIFEKLVGRKRKDERDRGEVETAPFVAASSLD